MNTGPDSIPHAISRQPGTDVNATPFGPIGGLVQQLGLLPTAIIAFIGTLVAFWLWDARTSGLQDALLILAFLYALWHYQHTSWAVWRQPAGLIALAVAAFMLIQIPFGVAPAIAWKASLKNADFIALAIALPALLGGPRRLGIALLSAALALTTVITADLARLAGTYGSRLADRARWDPNPALNHPNITAMAAAIAFILLASLAWRERRHRGVSLFCTTAMLLNLAYVILMRSRAVEVALVVACGAALVMATRNRRTRLIAATIVAIGLAAVFLTNPRFRQIGHVSALMDRNVVWAHTWQLIQQRPVLGHGFGETVFVNTYHTTHPPRSKHRFYHPHQYWLNTLFAYGLIGAALQATMWITLLLGLLPVLPGSLGRQGSVLPATVFAMILCLQIGGLVDCAPNVVGLTTILTVPVALLASSTRPRHTAPP